MPDSANLTSPSVGAIRRARMLRTVDLPQPDGPISATSSPSATSIEM